MREPSELMSKNYCGPSKVIPLGQIRNKDGFRFIGIDKDGGNHYCIVRKEGRRFFMDSNTITFDRLMGWIPDTQAPNERDQGPAACGASPAPTGCASNGNYEVREDKHNGMPQAGQRQAGFLL